MKPEIVDLTDAAAQINSIDQSLIQEAHEEAILRTSSSTNQELSQAHNGEPQPSTSAGFNSNQDHGTFSGENEQKSADSKIKEEDELTFEHDASHLDKDMKNEVKLKTESVHDAGDGATNAAPEAEVKQEENSDDRILETSQVCAQKLHSYNIRSKNIHYVLPISDCQHHNQPFF